MNYIYNIYIYIIIIIILLTLLQRRPFRNRAGIFIRLREETTLSKGRLYSELIGYHSITELKFYNSEINSM